MAFVGATALAACSATSSPDAAATTPVLATSTTAGIDPLNTATVRDDETTATSGPGDGTAPTSTYLTISEVARTPIPLPPTTTIDPGALLPTLREGDVGEDVITLQRMLNNVAGTRLAPDGVYGPSTTEAVAEFQDDFGLRVTGEADHATRTRLTELDDGAATAIVSWPVPDIGDGSSLPCEVLVIGDSLMAGGESRVEAAIAEIGCTASADGVGGRSLSQGWQCRVFEPDGRTVLRLLPEAQPGNASCAPSGLELLELSVGRQGDIVVIALGTNDAGLYPNEDTLIAHWERALQLTGARPVIFLTTAARPGSSQVERQARYSAALDRWCDTQTRCRLADWALTTVAADADSYFDAVHLRSTATQQRANFIRDAVASVLAEPPPTTTTTSTTTTSTTSTTSTTTTSTTTTTTTVPSTTTSTTTTSTTSTTSTTTTSTTTTAPAESTTTTTTEP